MFKLNINYIFKIIIEVYNTDNLFLIQICYLVNYKNFFVDEEYIVDYYVERHYFD